MYRWATWALVARASPWLYIVFTTDAVVDGVRKLPAFWYPQAGRWAWVVLRHTVLLGLPGFIALGHVAIARPPSEERWQLRANPLGGDAPEPARVRRRPLEAGDLVVWYTDSVVEAQNPVGAGFGDRRRRHLLRKLDPQGVNPVAVHDLEHRAVAAQFQPDPEAPPDREAPP